MEYVQLPAGMRMPMLGFGTFKLADPKEGENALLEALRVGYRLIDTAQVYGTESVVGEALKKSGVPRSDLFITTKVRIADASYEKTLDAFEASLKRMALDYVDLYLVHHPFNDYYGAWRAMEKLYREGRVRALGVSNFYAARLQDFVMNNEIKPAVNQVEVNPFRQQTELQALAAEYGVLLESWGPFGQGNATLISHPVLQEIGGRHGKSAAQVILRWCIQRGIPVIPKSTRAERIRENFSVFDFVLSEEDMDAIRGLDVPSSPTHVDPAFARMIITRHST